MDDSVRFGLQAKAEVIGQFRDLEISEQEWLMPLLSRGIRTTMELLDLISEQPLIFEEIADELGIPQKGKYGAGVATKTVRVPVDLVDVIPEIIRDYQQLSTLIDDLIEFLESK